MEYFLPHSFAFLFGRVFGGACGNIQVAEPFISRHQQHDELLATMGLSNKKKTSHKSVPRIHHT